MSADEGFLRRWSRLKRQGDALPERDGDARQIGATADDLATQQSPEPTEELAPALPPTDSLTPNSDFSPFLQPKVPDALHKEALRRLWTSDSLFNQVDTLDIHNQDYSFPAVPAVVSTLWRVGQGMLETTDAAPVAPNDKEPASIRYDQDSTANGQTPPSEAAPVKVPSSIVAIDGGDTSG